MRKLTGQLKFRIWDMERPYSGSSIDGPGENALEEFVRIIANIETDLAILIQQADSVGLSKYSGRRIAHAVVETVKPEEATITSFQRKIRQSRELLRFHIFSLPAQPPGLEAFDDALLEEPINPSQSSTS